MAEGDPTSEGMRLIKEWLGCQQDLEHAKSRLNSAECALSNAENALAKWMLPPDAKPGEKIAIWFGDSLIQVEKGSVLSGGENESVGCMSSTRVTVRSRGKRFSDLR